MARPPEEQSFLAAQMCRRATPSTEPHAHHPARGEGALTMAREGAPDGDGAAQARDETRAERADRPAAGRRPGRVHHAEPVHCRPAPTTGLWATGEARRPRSVCGGGRGARAGRAAGGETELVTVPVVVTGRRTGSSLTARRPSLGNALA
ncbi:hypothetical protein FAIPA1_10479 [Frankia sp. AiPs1]